MRTQHKTLQFTEKLSYNEDRKHVRDGLSSALFVGNNLWLCCDERTSLERLTRQGDGSFAEHQKFDLNKLLDLPGDPNGEIDVEGLGFENHYLWLVGSHSLARKKPRKSESVERQIKRLTKLKDDPNRYLLARVPMVKDETGNYTLCKSCPNPDNPEVMLTAAQLMGNGKTNQLMELMAHDKHVKDFIPIPGKDNGFDIEGLALSGNKIFLGLRGPVLRGWAIMLEVEMEDTKPGYFQLKPIGKEKALYKKHFLHLEGMGIRELRIVKNDMLILAGPTMDLDGTISVYRWDNAVNQETNAIVHRKELHRLFDVPHGSGNTSGQDKAEGMASVDDNHILVVFDSPTDERKKIANGVLANYYKI